MMSYHSNNFLCLHNVFIKWWPVQPQNIKNINSDTEKALCRKRQDQNHFKDYKWHLTNNTLREHSLSMQAFKHRSMQ